MCCVGCVGDSQKCVLSIFTISSCFPVASSKLFANASTAKAFTSFVVQLMG